MPLSLRSPAALSLVVLLLGGASGAEACCGANGSPSFFAHQYHAFPYGQVPGYLGQPPHRRVSEAASAAR